MEICVGLESGGYDISVGPGIITKLFSKIQQCGPHGGAMLVVTNRKISTLFRKEIEADLRSNENFFWLVIPEGEKSKNLSTVSRILKKLIQLKANRESVLVALGGGVVGDITGFAASVYMRGIPYYQVPTTLLAQVDSSVGGKTAVDFEGGKNLVGSFYQPKGVFIDTNTLKPLSNREFLCGVAEVIKYGVISGNSFLKYLEKNIEKLLKRDETVLKYVIKRSCEIKAEIVIEDEKETKGIRACLNFGHTVGHAVESATGYKKYKHGEAVAIGMVAAANISCKLGFIQEAENERLRVLLEKAGLPVKMPGLNRADLVKFMMLDKKVSKSRVKMVLMKSSGGVQIHSLTPREIERLLQG
ncbi:MAG: 3-dehydroquinate synthase [Nitrospinota bacterium]